MGRRIRTVDTIGNEGKIYYDSQNHARIEKTERIEQGSSGSYTVTTWFDYDDYGNVYKETLDVDGDGDNETSDMTTGYYYDGLDRVEKQVGADEIEGVFEYDAFVNMVCRMDEPDTERYAGLNQTTQTVLPETSRCFINRYQETKVE